MITDVLLYLASGFLSGLHLLFSVLNFVVPVQVTSAIQYFFSYFGYLSGVIPIDTLFSVVSVYVAFMGFYYTYKLALFLYALTPFFGKKAKVGGRLHHSSV